MQLRANRIPCLKDMVTPRIPKDDKCEELNGLQSHML